MPDTISTTFVDPNNTAVLVIDIQNDYCAKDGRVATDSKLDVSPIEEMVPRLEAFIDTARTKGLPIIYTQMIGDPAFMLENARIKRGTTSYCTPDTPGFDLYELKPQDGDIVLTKNMYDAFSNPELDTVLKERAITNLIVTGVNTSICVDSTVRAGFTRGYHIVIPKDLVGMPKERQYQHDATIDVWDFIFAHISTSNEILSVWEG